MTREAQARQLLDILRDRIGDRQLVLFLDYDGALAAAAEHPDAVLLDDETRRNLQRLAGVHPLQVMSGRDQGDVQARLGIEGIQCIGSYGFHMMDALPQIDRPALEEAVVELDCAANELEHWLDYIEGVVIDRKKYSFALHYRMVDRDDLQQINAAASDVLERYASLAWKKGKKVIEFVPDIPWDKGLCVKAVLARLRETSGSREPFVVYIGDGAAAEEAFAVLDPDTGLSVLVVDHECDSAAEFRLRDPEAVGEFLGILD